MFRAAFILAAALALPVTASAQIRALDELSMAQETKDAEPTAGGVTLDAVTEAANALREFTQAGEDDEPAADRTPVHIRIIPNRRIEVTFDDGSESTYCLQNGQYVMCG